MRRKGNPFHLGGGVFDLVRVRQLTGFIGFDYARCVNRQRGRERQPEDFASQGRDWGRHFYGEGEPDEKERTVRRRRTPLVRHGSKWYLDLKRETVIRTEHQRITTGEIVEDAQLQPFLRADDGRYERRRQGVGRPVFIRDYGIANIAQITIDGTLYVMSPCPNTRLQTAAPHPSGGAAGNTNRNRRGSGTSSKRCSRRSARSRQT